MKLKGWASNILKNTTKLRDYPVIGRPIIITAINKQCAPSFYNGFLSHFKYCFCLCERDISNFVYFCKQICRQDNVRAYQLEESGWALNS